jgi:hypothetical protein
VLAVLDERRGADAVQLAAGEHRLEHVARVHGPFGRARADHRVQLVDEEQDPPLGGPDLREHGLEALLELPAVLGAGHQGAHVEREHDAVAQSLGHVAADDPLRQALDDGRLADAGLADQHRVALGLAREDLDHPADLLVPPDHRVEPLGARLLDQVAAVLLERLVRRLGRRARDPLGAAHLRQGLQQSLRGHAGLAQDPAGGLREALVEHRERQVLDGDVLVLEALRLLEGPVEQRVQAPRHVHLPRGDARPGAARPPVEMALEGGAQPLDVHLRPRQQPRNEPLGLVQERGQKVLDVGLGVAEAQCQRLRLLDRLLGALGQAVRVHLASLWRRRRSSSSMRSRSSHASRAPA